MRARYRSGRSSEGTKTVRATYLVQRAGQNAIARRLFAASAPARWTLKRSLATPPIPCPPLSNHDCVAENYTSFGHSPRPAPRLPSPERRALCRGRASPPPPAGCLRAPPPPSRRRLRVASSAAIVAGEHQIRRPASSGELRASPSSTPASSSSELRRTSFYAPDPEPQVDFPPPRIFL